MTMDGIEGLYVGVDPSLTSPGLAVVDAAGKVLFADSFSVRRDVRGAARLVANEAWASETLSKLAKPLLRACIEGPSLGSTHREFDLGEGSGVLKRAVYHYGAVEPIVIAPTRLKLFATGKAQAEKVDVLHAVKNQFGLDLKNNDDAADALMLAYLAWALDHSSQLTRRSQLEVVRDVLNPVVKQKRVRLNTKTNL